MPAITCASDRAREVVGDVSLPPVRPRCIAAQGFEAMEADTEHLWIVEFLAPWCGHCKRFVPAYEKAASSLKDIVRFGAVDAEEHRAIAATHGVQGFPTVKAFLPERSVNPYTGVAASSGSVRLARPLPAHVRRGLDARRPGDLMRPTVTYNGGLNAKSVVNFATALMPNLVENVTDEETFQRFVREGAAHVNATTDGAPTVWRALLFSAKDTTGMLLKSLALRLRGRMAIGEAKMLPGREQRLAGVVKQLGVQAELPALVLVPSGPQAAEEAPLHFAGSLKYGDLWTFLDGHAPPRSEPQAASGGGGGAKSSAGSSGRSMVEELSPEQVATEVEGDIGAWVLALDFGAGAGEEDDAVGVDLERLGRQLQGQARVGRLDMGLEGAGDVAARYGAPVDDGGGRAVRLVVLPYGVEAKRPAKAIAVDDAAAAKKAAGDSLPADLITRVNAGSMDPLLMATVADGSEAMLAACILLTDKGVPAVYRALSLRFQNAFAFGVGAASDAALVQHLNLEKVPALICLWPDRGASKDGQGQEAVAFTGARLDDSMGPMTFSSMANFLVNIAAQIGGPNWAERMAGGSARDGGGPRTGAKDPPVPTEAVVEVTKDNVELLTGSESGSGLVALALLDGDRTTASTEEREGHLQVLAGLATRRRGEPVRVAWADATCHESLLALFDVSDVDLPTMVVIAPAKGLYARLTGTFTIESMSRLVTQAVHGRAATQPVETLPLPMEDVDCDTTLRGAARAAAFDEAGSEDDDIVAEILAEEAARKAALENAAAASEPAGADGGGEPALKGEEGTSEELQRLLDELEDCGAHDLLCAARREKQLERIEKRRRLEEDLRKISEKKVRSPLHAAPGLPALALTRVICSDRRARRRGRRPRTRRRRRRRKPRLRTKTRRGGHRCARGLRQIGRAHV